MIEGKWKARLGIAQARYKKGVMMVVRKSCNMVMEVRKVRKHSVNLALKVSEARHTCLGLLRDAQEAGEVELARRLSEVWDSFGGSVECLFDAWTRLAAIEKGLP